MRNIGAAGGKQLSERRYSARFLVLLALQSGLGFGCMQFARASPAEACSNEMSRQAQSSLADARGDWPALLKHQTAFAACDDGALGEGYSEAVVRLLAQRRGQIGTFAALGKAHPAFQRWVIRHIDATASDEELNSIIANATNCSGDASVRNLCRTIRQTASDALSESAQMRQR